MNFADSLFPSKPRRPKGHHPLCQQDLIMYQALTGRSAEIQPEPEEESLLHSGIAPIKTIAQRLKPNVAQITGRLKTLYEHGAGPKRQQVTDWFKNLSEQAFTRLDEAQARLNAARPRPAKIHPAERVILTLHPQDVTGRTESVNVNPTSGHYKHVA